MSKTAPRHRDKLLHGRHIGNEHQHFLLASSSTALRVCVCVCVVCERSEEENANELRRTDCCVNITYVVLHLWPISSARCTGFDAHKHHLSTANVIPYLIRKCEKKILKAQTDPIAWWIWEMDEYASRMLGRVNDCSTWTCYTFFNFLFRLDKMIRGRCDMGF